jgi:polysaccharide pyruvyl transferase WcaK-like protein
MRRADLVLIGGGTLLQQDRGPALVRGLPRLCAFGSLCARLAGADVAFVGVGALPIERRLPRLLLRVATRATSTLFVREATSQDVVARNLGRRSQIAGDLSLLLRRSAGIAPLNGAEQAKQGRLLLALAPMEAAMLTPDVLRQMSRSYNGVLFVSLGQRPEPDAASLGVESTNLLDVIPADLQWQELLPIATSVDVIVASRLHAMYLATLTGKRLIAVGDSLKTRAFAEEFGVPRVAVSELPSRLHEAVAPSTSSADRAEERLRVALDEIVPDLLRRGGSA